MAAPVLTRAGDSACLIWQMFPPEAFPDGPLCVSSQSVIYYTMNPVLALY